MTNKKHTKKTTGEIHQSLSNTFNVPARQGMGVELDFDAQVLASLMLQSNAFVSIKMAVKLCSISRQEIDRRIHVGTFPKPVKLSGEEKSIRKAFRIQDIVEWLNAPKEYKQPNRLL